MWDLSSLTRDWTCAPCSGGRVPITGPPEKSHSSNFLRIEILLLFGWDDKTGVKTVSLQEGCCRWVTKSCMTLWDPMDCSQSSFPVFLYLPEFTQTHVHSSQWCHPTISSTAVPFFSCPQSFPASGSFLMIWLFISGGQSIGASASILLMNIQGWFPLGFTGLSPCHPRDSRIFSSTTVQKH